MNNKSFFSRILVVVMILSCIFADAITSGAAYVEEGYDQVESGSALHQWNGDSLTATSCLTQPPVLDGEIFNYYINYDVSVPVSSVVAESRSFEDGSVFNQGINSGYISDVSGNLGVFTIDAPSEGRLYVYASAKAAADIVSIELYGFGDKIKGSSLVDFNDQSHVFVYNIDEKGMYKIASTSGVITYYGMAFVPKTEEISEEETEITTIDVSGGSAGGQKTGAETTTEISTAEVIEETSSEETTFENSTETTSEEFTEETTADTAGISEWNVPKPWNVTVFGNVGGLNKIYEYDMTTRSRIEPPVFALNPKTGKTYFDFSGDEQSLNIRADQGKFTDISEGFAFCYQAVDAAEDFEIKGKIKINDYGVGLATLSFGAIVTDSVKDNVNTLALTDNYVAAAPLCVYDKENSPFGYANFARSNGEKKLTLSDNKLTAAPKKGDTVDVSITKVGNKYTVNYGGMTADYELQSNSSTVYAGFFAARADITITDITFTGSAPTQAAEASENKTVTDIVSEVVENILS